VHVAGDINVCCLCVIFKYIIYICWIALFSSDLMVQSCLAVGSPDKKTPFQQLKPISRCLTSCRVGHSTQKRHISDSLHAGRIHDRAKDTLSESLGIDPYI